MEQSNLPARAAASRDWLMQKSGLATASPQTKRTVVSALAVVVLVALVGLGFATMTSRLNHPQSAANGSAANGQSGANGSGQGVLLGGTPAPTFTLTDQTGATVSLDSLKGRPTVLTFFDSVCPHTDCSLMAQYINFTSQEAGADASRVNWVAISLNPWHDTRDTVNAFINNQKLHEPQFRYLMGDVNQLQPLWDAFHMQSIEQSNGIVIHTTGVYLLDSQAKEQVFLDEGFDPHVLSADMHTLLTKGDSAFAGQQGAQSSNAVTETHNLGADMAVTLTSTPGQYGTYNFMAQVQGANGTAVPNAKVSLDMTMPDMAMAPVHVDLQPLQPASTGAYEAKGVLSMKGQWLITVSVTPQGASQPVTSTFSLDAKY